MRENYMFTSESVTQGHPDKLCDQISDAIVDRFLAADPTASIIAESAVAKGLVFLAARFASQANIDLPGTAREVIEDVGYREGDFNARDCTILTSFSELPKRSVVPDERDLSEAELDKLVARDQVTAFGFACTQTDALMPLPITLAHKLARRLDSVRIENQLTYLRPDGKTQVGVEYRGRKPHRIHSITVIASQASAGRPSRSTLRDDMVEAVIMPAFVDNPIQPDKGTIINVNPEGTVLGGGPALHSGLTGRKNAIDAYGEYCRRSGAALSGKDPTRIDRVAAYAARYAAANVVAAGLAEECEIHLSYTIGVAQPVSIEVDTFGTGNVEDDDIRHRVKENFDFRLGAILRQFELRHLPARQPGGFYRLLATYGHMGRTDLNVPWEERDKVDVLG